MGIERFRDYLEALRSGSREEPPLDFLWDDGTSEELAWKAVVERRVFANKLMAAAYLDKVFQGISCLEEDVGLWSWLSLFFFDQVCPAGGEGERKPGRDYRHILEPGYRYGYRHLLRGPFLVYRLHGERARLLLYSKVYRDNEFHREIASRQAFVTNPAILDALNLLYLDKRKKRPKRGALGKGASGGTLRRFVSVVQQLELNYDLYSMSGEAILGLLPKEFDPWKPRKGLRLFRGRKKKS